MLLLVLLVVACAAKSTLLTAALPADNDLDLAATKRSAYDGGYQADGRFLSDIATNDEYDNDADDYPTGRGEEAVKSPQQQQQQQRFKVVRNPNGTLSLVILGQPTTTTTTASPIAPEIDSFSSQSDIHFNHSTEDDDVLDKSKDDADSNDDSNDDIDDDDGDIERTDDLMLDMMAGKATTTGQQTGGTFGADHEQVQRTGDPIVDGTRRKRATDNIVFPTDSGGTSPFAATGCGSNRTFCEDEDDYPLAAIEAIIAREEHRYKGLFDSEQSELASRFGGDDDSEQPMCDRIILTKWPKSAMTEDNKWAYIVNSDKYQQGVRVEECKSADKECNFAKNFGNGVRTVCRQLYMNRKLLAVKDMNSPAETMVFQFPSCCQCRVITSSSG